MHMCLFTFIWRQTGLNSQSYTHLSPAINMSTTNVVAHTCTCMYMYSTCQIQGIRLVLHAFARRDKCTCTLRQIHVYKLNGFIQGDKCIYTRRQMRWPYTLYLTGTVHVQLYFASDYYCTVLTVRDYRLVPCLIVFLTVAILSYMYVYSYFHTVIL